MEFNSSHSFFSLDFAPSIRSQSTLLNEPKEESHLPLASKELTYKHGSFIRGEPVAGLLGVRKVVLHGHGQVQYSAHHIHQPEPTSKHPTSTLKPFVIHIGHFNTATSAAVARDLVAICLTNPKPRPSRPLKLKLNFPETSYSLEDIRRTIIYLKVWRKEVITDDMVAQATDFAMERGIPLSIVNRAAPKRRFPDFDGDPLFQ